MHVEGERHVLLAAALSYGGQRDASREHYASAERIANKSGGALRLELELNLAVDAWNSRDTQHAQDILKSAFEIVRVPGDSYSRSFATLRAQALELSGLLAGAREDYVLQAALLVEASRLMAETSSFERDISVQASILCNLAPLVWDHHLVDESEILWHAATTIPWTAELATARYVVHRSLAWHAALKGHNIDALARFRECADFAPTISWRLASTLDRAYLAAQMREKIILREEMLRAGTFAACISWDDVAGDEAELLLDLAEANARTDVTIARGWLDAYDRAAAPKGNVLSRHEQWRDARRRDALGTVLAAEGCTTLALASLRAAVVAWDELSVSWRSARSALALAVVSKNPLDAAAAKQRSLSFHGSWLIYGARAITRNRSRSKGGLRGE